MKIWRTECPAVGVPFKAPRAVSFGWQHDRGVFSVWHVAEAESSETYVVLGTDWEFPGIAELVASVVMSDGFHVFHLCRLRTRE